MINVVPVPDWLKQSIGKAQHEDVLYRLLAEIMIDAIDLVLFEDIKQFSVEHARGCEIGPERLFDDYPTPGAIVLACKAGTAEMATDRRERSRRRREIEQAIATCRPHLFDAVQFLPQGFVGSRILSLAAHMRDAVQQSIGNHIVDRARREFTQAFCQTASEGIAR